VCTSRDFLLLPIIDSNLLVQCIIAQKKESMKEKLHEPLFFGIYHEFEQIEARKTTIEPIWEQVQKCSIGSTLIKAFNIA
jgi:hypothetical protein